MGQTGFTLIELMVVISIISFLASILFSTFAIARNDASDNVVSNDMTVLDNALELYYQDNGVYPFTGMHANCGPDFPFPTTGMYCIYSTQGIHTQYAPIDNTSNIAILTSLLVPTYMNKLPPELINSGRIKNIINLVFMDKNGFDPLGENLSLYDSTTMKCWQLEPNGFLMYSALYSNSLQGSLNGYPSRGYFLVSTNIKVGTENGGNCVD